MKIIYLSFLLQLNFVFAQSQVDVLKNIGQFSDDELFRIAKQAREQALPGELDYAQILLIETVRKNPENQNALVELNQLKKTNTTFQNAIDSGNTIALHLQLGIRQYQEKNKLKEAVGNLTFVINALKDRPFVSTDTVYFVHAHLVRALFANKNYKRAEQELNFLAEHAFQSRNNFIILTNDLFKSGFEKFLETPMRIAIANDPMFAYPYSALADILKKQNKIEEAEEYHQKFVLLHSQ